MPVKYNFDAWIHPRDGGDDYPISGTVELRMETTHDEEVVKQEIIKILKKKRSAVLDDYQIRRATA
jgi:hypothetical protein